DPGELDDLQPGERSRGRSLAHGAAPKCKRWPPLEAVTARQASAPAWPAGGVCCRVGRPALHCAGNRARRATMTSTSEAKGESPIHGREVLCHRSFPERAPM